MQRLPRRHFTDDFKTQMVALAESIRQGNPRARRVGQDTRQLADSGPEWQATQCPH